MKNITAIMGCLILAALFIPLLVASVRAGPKSSSLRQLRRALGFPSDVVLNAFMDGRHENGVLTKKADAAHSYRHLLVKVGSDADHIAVCGAGDLPLGICDDTPAAAEDPANVAALGAIKGTVIMVGSEAIAADVDVFTAASGEVQDEPAVAGTYYLVGRTVKSCAAAHKEVEVVPCKPIKLTVIAAMTSTNGTMAAAADDAATKAEGEKIGDDVRAIAAALATPGLVKVLAA